jgi:hypothetical protein
MIRKGRFPDFSGLKNGNGRITDEEVEEIRSATGSQSEIGRRFGVAQQTVCKIKNGARRAKAKTI